MKSTDVLRIVCLVPSITELLVDLGLASWLVGRTGFCIHPHHIVADVAKVGGTKDVNLRKIAELAPSHVIVNVDENTLPTVEKLRQIAPHVIVTHPRSPRYNLALIDQLQSEFAIYLIALKAMHTLGGLKSKCNTASLMDGIWLSLKFGQPLPIDLKR